MRLGSCMNLFCQGSPLEGGKRRVLFFFSFKSPYTINHKILQPLDPSRAECRRESILLYYYYLICAKGKQESSQGLLITLGTVIARA